MKRIVSGLKKLAELYLFIVGGGYALTSAVGLVVNTRNFFQSTDEIEAKAFRQDATEGLTMFLFASLLLAAGIGIHKFRLWGLVLAIGMAILTIGYCVSQRRLFGVWDYHDFTITLPMAMIFVWAILPPTWATFSKRSNGAV